MSIINWVREEIALEKRLASDPPGPVLNPHRQLWTQCDKCGGMLYLRFMRDNDYICTYPECKFYLKLTYTLRVNSLVEEKTWRPLYEMMSPGDPLEFEDKKTYVDRLTQFQQRTGFQDAVEVGTGFIEDIPVALGVMSFTFMGGSMGSVVGEQITRLIEYATKAGLPVIIVCASGGARMQEGVFSLMQMGKISAALNIHQNYAKLLFISILTSPTTGGVTASFAMLGDFIIAEPQAVIGFAGRRVIEQTLKEYLPEDFQTSEYLMKRGMLDLILERKYLKGMLHHLITVTLSNRHTRQGFYPADCLHPEDTFLAESYRRDYRAPDMDPVTKDLIPQKSESETLTDDSAYMDSPERSSDSYYSESDSDILSAEAVKIEGEEIYHSVADTQELDPILDNKIFTGYRRFDNNDAFLFEKNKRETEEQEQAIQLQIEKDIALLKEDISKVTQVCREEIARQKVILKEQAKIDAVENARKEAERVEAERLAAIEAERIEAERIEAERIEAERIEAERVEAERVEAEMAAEKKAQFKQNLEFFDGTRYYKLKLRKAEQKKQIKLESETEIQNNEQIENVSEPSNSQDTTVNYSFDNSNDAKNKTDNSSDSKKNK